MERLFGYYRVHLERDGYKTAPLIVYAGSTAQAVLKALQNIDDELPSMRVYDVDGPHLNAEHF